MTPTALDGPTRLRLLRALKKEMSTEPESRSKKALAANLARLDKQAKRIRELADTKKITPQQAKRALALLTRTRRNLSDVTAMAAVARSRALGLVERELATRRGG
jgi:hypothetical protein